MKCHLILKELCSFFHKIVDRWLTSKTIPRKVDALISVIPYRWKNMRALCGVGGRKKPEPFTIWFINGIECEIYSACVSSRYLHILMAHLERNEIPLPYVPSHEEKGIGTFLLKKIHILRSVSITRFAFVCRSGSKKHSQERVILIINDLFHGILLLLSEHKWANLCV